MCRHVINDTVSLQFSHNLDIVTHLSENLASEGVVMSNAKILKIVVALRSLIKVYYRVFTKASETSDSALADVGERVSYQLSMRTSLKE